MTPKASHKRAANLRATRKISNIPFSEVPSRIFNRNTQEEESPVSHRKINAGAKSTRNSPAIFGVLGASLCFRLLFLISFFIAALTAPPAFSQAKRKVVIDEDCAGPGGTDMQALLTLINSKETEVLGITVV